MNIKPNQSVPDTINKIILKLENISNNKARYYLPIGNSMPIEDFNNQLFCELRDILHIINSILERFYNEIPAVNLKLKTLQIDLEYIAKNNINFYEIKELCMKYKLELGKFHTKQKLYSRLCEVYTARVLVVV